MARNVVAVVDCGTNTTRLLIARTNGSDVIPLRRSARITRLGHAVDRTGCLGGDAIARVARVISDYADTWTAAGADAVAVVATSAVRDTADRRRFDAAVRSAAGVAPVVLTGAQEAALTFVGATAADAGRRVVCDIGGGSTELAAGHDGSVQRWASLRIGSVRLRERYLHDDPPTPGQYAALGAAIDAALDGHPTGFTAADGELLTVAGTATTVAAVARELSPDAVDDVVLSSDEVAQVVEMLAWVPAARRRAYAAIAAGRDDVVVAGAMLLQRVLVRFGHASARVRVPDLLDGVATRIGQRRWEHPVGDPGGDIRAGSSARVTGASTTDASDAGGPDVGGGR